MVDPAEVVRQVTKYRGRENLSSEIDQWRRPTKSLWLGRSAVPAAQVRELIATHGPFADSGEEAIALFWPSGLVQPVRPIVWTDRAIYAWGVPGAFRRSRRTKKSDQGPQRIAIEDLGRVDYDFPVIRIADRWAVAVEEPSDPGHPGDYVVISLFYDLAQLTLSRPEREWEPEVWLHDDLVVSSGQGITTSARFPARCVVCMAETRRWAPVPLRSNVLGAGTEYRWQYKHEWVQGVIDLPYCGLHDPGQGVEPPAWGTPPDGERHHLVLTVDADGRRIVTAIGLRFSNPEFAAAFAALNDLPLG